MIIIRNINNKIFISIIEVFILIISIFIRIIEIFIKIINFDKFILILMKREKYIIIKIEISFIKNKRIFIKISIRKY